MATKKVIAVWRIEDEEGLGPYRAEVSWRWQRIQNHSDENHPEPQDDPKLRKIFKLLKEGTMITSMFCGFESKASLRAWFNEIELASILLCGMRLVVYTTNQYYKGSKQIIFRKVGARRIPAVDWSA